MPAERKSGAHLGAEERGAIHQLKKLGYSHRAIGREMGCSPSTVGYELKLGTPPYSGRGRRPSYSTKRGAAVYKANRSRCRRPKIVPRDSSFIRWMVTKVRVHKWSLDTCVGRAKLKRQFPTGTIPITKILYNLLWNGELPLSLFDVPEVLSRRKRGKPRISKCLNGTSIDLRPEEVAQRTTFGHWESDTVLGKKRRVKRLYLRLLNG